ncbi:HTH-type transcriptional activator Btr [compost metagenome]
MQTAAFLDREKEGERWLTRYEEEADTLRQSIPDGLRHSRLAILSLSPKGIQLWGRRAGTVLYDDLQLRAVRGAGKIKFTQFMEAEQLPALEADALFISVAKDRQSQDGWEQLRQTEAWNSLKAVRSGKVYLASGQAWLSEPYLEYTANRHSQLLQELKIAFRAL